MTLQPTDASDNYSHRALRMLGRGRCRSFISVSMVNMLHGIIMLYRCSRHATLASKDSNGAVAQSAGEPKAVSMG
jgi:hypothetical protein